MAKAGKAAGADHYGGRNGGGGARHTGEGWIAGLSARQAAAAAAWRQGMKLAPMEPDPLALWFKTTAEGKALRSALAAADGAGPEMPADPVPL